MSTTENPDKKILRVVQRVIKMLKQNEELFRPLLTENLSGARIFIPPNITAPNYAINLHLNKPWCLIYFQTKSAHDAPYLTADYNMIVDLAQCNRDHSNDRFPFLYSIFQLVS